MVGTGLMYYNARYYHPALGRFVSADTIVPEAGNPQSLNRYAYVLNNPLRYVDPNGNIPEIIYDETLGIYMVKLDIQIYGSGASDSLAKEWEEHLNEVWNCGDYDYEGQPVFFVINIYHQNPDFSLGGKLLNALGF